MSEAAGYITAVQEERFRLLTDEGQSLLLNLAHNAPVSSQDVCRLQAANVHVTVRYEGEPNSSACVARAVVPSGNDRTSKP